VAPGIITPTELIPGIIGLFLQTVGCPSSIAAQTLHQEDKHMTRTELDINQQDMWRILVFEQRTTLTLAVEMLLHCHLSPEQILTKTAVALEGSHHDS
jgi:hypothetical protein